MSVHPCEHPTSEGARDIYMTEIFSAIQGEGHFAGSRQVFVRLSGCNLRCAYCDQPESLELRPGQCRVESAPGSRSWRTYDSPVSVEDATRWVDDLMSAFPHHSVSVTGGEPLMQSGRLASFLPRLRELGHRIHLETSGVLHHGLARVVEWVDAISMDIKLDSADHQHVDFSAHESFLRVACEASNHPYLYAKIVVVPETTAGELCTALQRVVELVPDIDLYLQPVTPFGAVATAPSPMKVLDLQEVALRVHPKVKVLPQTHKMIGQL